MYHISPNLTPGSGVNFPEHQLLYLPGVIDRFTFIEQCEGCLSCAEACPHNAITFVQSEPGVRYPFINPREVPCSLCDDMPCSHACPNEALVPLPKDKVRMGKAMLDPLRCRCLNDGECRICYEACPLSGFAIIWDDEINAPLINLNHCVGCGVCLHDCPSSEQPIMIIPA